MTHQDGKYKRTVTILCFNCTGVLISPLPGPGRKQALKHVRGAHDFNNIETRTVIEYFFFLQGKAPKEIHAILTETLACFLPDRAKDLSASMYIFESANDKTYNAHVHVRRIYLISLTHFALFGHLQGYHLKVQEILLMCVGPCMILITEE